MHIRTELISHLPAWQIAGKLNKQLEQASRVVVTAPPGAGKSTLLPLTILASVEGKILMLEPRRLAARLVAERMASLLGEEVGETVGYRIRFENRISDKTRIEVLTEGILTRMLVDDPMLDGVAVVIFDEFHERSLMADLGLALSREAQEVVRPDLRIVVMSATIDAAEICTALDAPLVECEGRMYPVEVRHLPREEDSTTVESIARDMVRAILMAHREEEGDILAFLPGQAEILRCKELLADSLGDTSLHPLYGLLSSEEQQQAIRPSVSGRRKVVLATNIAETSLTIEGIRIVIDSGWQRKMVFNPQTELSHLCTIPISLDMATQRMGRAGRMTEGICYRLWSLPSEHRMAPCRQPEIMDADLSSLVLDVAAWGESSPISLPWITPPPANSLHRASTLLQLIGATDMQGRITTLGRQMSHFATHPRIARMMLAACTAEEKALAADIAALLEERDPVAGVRAETTIQSDLNLRIQLLRDSRRGHREGRMSRLLHISEDYRRRIGASEDNDYPEAELTGKLLAMAYPERIARAQDRIGHYRMANGTNVRLELSDGLSGTTWLAIAHLNASTGRVFLASPVRESDIRRMGRWADRLNWNSKDGCLICQQELRIGQLLLDTKPLQAAREQQIEALCLAVESNGESMLDFSKAVTQLQLRVAQVDAWHPELALPDLGTAAVLRRCRDWLPFFLDNGGRLMTTTSQLKHIDVAAALWTLLSYEQQQEVSRLAPSHIVVPTGSRIRLDYRQGTAAPVLSVRLQECFGLTDTPCIDGGRQPVLMELLSPGFKPVQLTQDLHSFWEDTYFEVRKELRRRYPKHHWPDNPLEALPTRGVRSTNGPIRHCVSKQLSTFILLFCLAVLSAAGQTCRLLTTADGLTSSLVSFVYEDHYGLIWIGTEDGLNRYDGVKLTAYRHVKGDETSLASNYVSTMIEDAEGQLIVSTHNGMQLYRHDTDDFSPLATFADGRAMHENVSRLKLDPSGRLYGTGDLNCEVAVKDRDHVEIIPMPEPYFRDEISRELTLELNVRTTLRYDSRRLLLGTDGQGVKLYDEKLHTYTNFPLDIPGIPRPLQKVHHLMRDRSGNLWAALYQKGVVMMSQQRSMFGYIGPRTAQHDLIGAHCVQSIFRSRDGGMWIGTDGDGLYYLKGETAKHCTSGVPPIINAVMEDSEGTLWLGSYGYPCYRGENGVFSQVRGLPEHPRVFTIREDRQRRVWLGTMYNGLYCYDMDSLSIKRVDFQGMNRFVNCLCVLSGGDVLAGTYNGIYNVTRQEHLLAKQIIYAMHEDARGRLWVGTAEGLVLLDGGRQKVYTTADGMSSSLVYAICEDEQGRLWISSNNGLMCLDECSGVFTNYSVSDGLQGNEFSKGAALRDADGTLWFAGHEGITYFAPASISQFQYELHPRISALYINNVCVNTRTRTGGKPVITAALYDAREFSLAYEDNSLSIELATAEIDRPAGCVFTYALDGGAWITIPRGGHLVTFSNLPAGRHKLSFAVEYDGKRSVAEEISINIRHPWWSSVWMKSLLVSILVGIVTLFLFWIRSKEKVKALALISHKIRTPMSLIISPLVQLIDSDPDEQRQKTYRLMLRNAEKLQHLAAQATEEEPIGPIPDLNAEEPITANRHKSSTSRQLIIVEDDEEVLRYLTEQLSSEYHVREARNGKEALELIFQKMPDAIISDVTMPEMDGITLCHKLKKNIHLAHIPVILLTARADEEATLQGLGTGADAYITKPFNTKILRQTLSNLILLRQQLKNTYQDQQLQEDKLKELEGVNYEDQFMERLMDCINRHISQQDFTIEMLCEEIGISRVHLHRRIKKRTNQSTSIFIRNVRLRLAEKLLLESDMSISQVAERVGFGSLPHFSKAFKEQYGVSPIEWRERNKAQS